MPEEKENEKSENPFPQIAKEDWGAQFKKPSQANSQSENAASSQPGAVHPSGIGTFGEQLVGRSFNPSKDAKVDRIKAICAELADIVESHQFINGNSYLFNLTRGKALGEILNAQMLAVKLVTLK